MISVCLVRSPHANPQLNDRPNEICSRRSAPRHERTNGENNAAVKSRGRNHVWEERQITRKYIQRKGGNHCDGYRIGDSRLLADTQYLPAGRKSLADSEPMDGKATRLELRSNRKKGRKLSAQFKAKAPPYCTGGSGLLHTKCVSISVKPPRKVWRIKLSV